MEFDVVIIGAGIAGASAAYFASRTRKVLLLERESQPGYHTTGRSAAVYTENYASDLISSLVRASRPFLRNPPPGFADHPILSPLGRLTIANGSQLDVLEKEWKSAVRRVPSIERNGSAFAIAKAPILKPESVAGCLWEREASDIDVHGLHQGYLRGLTANGGTLVNSSEVTRIDRRNGKWCVNNAKGEAYSAPVLINAAGAWAEQIGQLAGAAKIGIQPRRRTAALVDVPSEVDAVNLPMVIDVGYQFYFRPNGGKLLVSPADQTPVEPCDVQPEEIDVAIAIDRLESVTTLRIRHVARRWAGLRTFTPDEIPAAGWDKTLPRFYWLAGQGGAGIKTSPALGMLTAALLDGKPEPDALAREGVRAAELSPARFASAP